MLGGLWFASTRRIAYHSMFQTISNPLISVAITKEAYYNSNLSTLPFL